jgi:hypothetical protein
MSSLSIVVHLLISICSRSTYVMYFLLLFPIKTDIHKAVPSCCCYPTAWIVCYVHILNHKWTSVWVYGYLETRQLFGCSSIVLSLPHTFSYCFCFSVHKHEWAVPFLFIMYTGAKWKRLAMRFDGKWDRTKKFFQEFCKQWRQILKFLINPGIKFYV